MPKGKKFNLNVTIYILLQKLSKISEGLRDILKTCWVATSVVRIVAIWLCFVVQLTY